MHSERKLSSTPLALLLSVGLALGLLALWDVYPGRSGNARHGFLLVGGYLATFAVIALIARSAPRLLIPGFVVLAVAATAIGAWSGTSLGGATGGFLGAMRFVVVFGLIALGMYLNRTRAAVRGKVLAVSVALGVTTIVVGVLSAVEFAGLQGRLDAMATAADSQNAATRHADGQGTPTLQGVL